MYKFIAIGLSALLFSACSSDVTTVSDSEKPGGYTVFDSVNGNIPYPNNILFSGSTDGTININASDDDPAKPLKDMLDTLDGFSTSAAISVGVTEEVDTNSLAKGLKLYKVIAQASEATGGIPAVGAIEKELTYGVDFYASYANGKIIILPTIPLESHSNYMVVLTKDITNLNGQSIAPDATTTMINGTFALINPTTGEPTAYFNENSDINTATAKKLEGLRLLNQAMYLAMLNNKNDCSATESGVTCNNVVMSWSFQTQTIGKVANNFIENNISSAVLEVNSTQLPTPKGTATIYTGFLKNTPYYLGVMSKQNPTAPLNYSFTYAKPILPATQESIDKALPIQTATQDLPIFMTIPNETNSSVMPENGWPIVIYQHGITRNRTDLIALADSFAAAGYAAIAMDLPLHGIDKLEDISKPFYVAGKERNFDMDFINNETGEAGPDGIIDPSGTHYINLAGLLTSRDNVRQSTSDFTALYNALSSIKGVKIDTSRIAFVGHSLGTIAPFGFLNHTLMETTTLAMPGANITQLLNFSATRGPILRAGLEAAGIEPDSAEYNSFLLSAQTILDDADPINYTLTMPASQKIFAIEVIGDNNANLPDQTIPNNAFPYAPLAGTDPMLTLMGVQDLNVSALNENNQYIVPSNTVSRFTVGKHESILDPEDIAITEMQTQIASFLGSKGSVIQVIDPSILKQ